MPGNSASYPKRTFHVFPGGTDQVAVYEYQTDRETGDITERIYKFTGTVTREQSDGLPGEWQ
jgi:hypothetical protein